MPKKHVSGNHGIFPPPKTNQIIKLKPITSTSTTRKIFYSVNFTPFKQSLSLNNHCPSISPTLLPALDFHIKCIEPNHFLIIRVYIYVWHLTHPEIDKIVSDNVPASPQQTSLKRSQMCDNWHRIRRKGRKQIYKNEPGELLVKSKTMKEISWLIYFFEIRTRL